MSDKCYTIEIHGQKVKSHVYPVRGLDKEHQCQCGEKTVYTVPDRNYRTCIRSRKFKGKEMYEDMVNKNFWLVKGTNKKLGLTFTRSHPFHTKEEAEREAKKQRSRLGSDWVLWTKIMKVDSD